MIKKKLKWWKSHAWHWIISDANVVLIIKLSTLFSLIIKEYKIKFFIEFNRPFFICLNWIFEENNTFFNNIIILFEINKSTSITNFFVYNNSNILVISFNIF